MRHRNPEVSVLVKKSGGERHLYELFLTADRWPKRHRSGTDTYRVRVNGKWWRPEYVTAEYHRPGWHFVTLEQFGEFLRDQIAPVKQDAHAESS